VGGVRLNPKGRKDKTLKCVRAGEGQESKEGWGQKKHDKMPPRHTSLNAVGEGTTRGNERMELVQEKKKGELSSSRVLDTEGQRRTRHFSGAKGKPKALEQGG